MLKSYIFVCSVTLASIFMVIFCCNVYFFDIFKTDYQQIVFQQAIENNLDPALIFAIIKEESGFNANALSKVGATGLMQIMPSTAISVSGENFKIENLKEEIINIKIGCEYLQYLFNKFNKLEYVLIAYNAGEGNLINWINNEQIDEKYNTPFAQTNAYVEKVLNSYKVYIKILNN